MPKFKPEDYLIVETDTWVRPKNRILKIKNINENLYHFYKDSINSTGLYVTIISAERCCRLATETEILLYV